MAQLKRKHPTKDFFIMDIADVVPKDDTASMEHPIFSLSTKPDMRQLRYDNGDAMLKVIPSGEGLATIHDKDVLIWAISKIIHAKNKGLPYSKTVQGSGYELLVATNRPTSKLGYERLEAAFTRLRGTTFVSTIRTGDRGEKRIFGMVDEASFEYNFDREMRRDKVVVTLSDWFFRAAENLEVVSISEDYFRLRRPLERRIYEIGRKHCGYKKSWRIGLGKLQQKTGSNAPLKRFRHNLRQIIAENHTPFYRMELDERDMVTFRPRKTQRARSNSVTIPSWAEEKCREIAQRKGWDYHVLEREWLAFADNPKDAGAAFVGFCKRKESLR